MVLSDRIILGRRTAYACCAAEYDAKATQALIYGDKACAKKEQQLAYAYMWAADVMSRTPLSTETGSCAGCVSHDFALQVIHKFDPRCVVCGCGDKPNTCDITPDITVYQAADADQQTVLPNVAGRTTLITGNVNNVSNGWSAHVGQIATDDGTGVFTYTTPAPAKVIYAATQAINYVSYTSGVGPLYPPIDGQLVFLNLTLFSRFPSVTALYSRDVLVETSPDGTNWTAVYYGPESSLATGVTVTSSSSPTFTRATYYYGQDNECKASVDGSIPPFVSPPCGILSKTITPVAVCGTSTWKLTVNFAQIDGWNIGKVTPIVNSVPGTPVPIVLGPVTLGPFSNADFVALLFENNIDIACNDTSPEYHDPRLPDAGYVVDAALDANQFPGTGGVYLISGNVDNVSNAWSTHVGEIWDSGTSSWIVPTNLSFVRTSVPSGPLAYWQIVSGVPLQVFPQPTFTLNTVTLIGTATLPTLPPFSSGQNILIQGRCNGTLFPTIYSGPGSSFVMQAFTPPCGVNAVTGSIIYTNGSCPFSLPAIVEAYTPTGDPDPNFSGLGVNSIVRTIRDSGRGDGSFYIGGSFDKYDPAGANITCNFFTRLNTDGTLDTAFNTVVNNPAATVPGFNARVDMVQVDNQRRVLVSGFFTTLNDNPVGHIVRLMPDGSVDPTFVTGTGFTGATVFDMTFVSGQIVCTGVFSKYNGTDVNNVAVLSQTGALVTTTQWAPVGAGFNGGSLRSGLAPDGTIVFNSGAYDSYNGVLVRPSIPKTVIRVNPDGALNSIIAQGSQFSEAAPPTSFEFAILPSGDIIYVGNFVSYNGTTANRILKTNSFGAINATFLTNTGTGFDDQTLGVDVMPNGQLMVGCPNTANFNGAPSLGLVRLNADGTRDNTWNLGTGFNNSVYVVHVDTFGNILVGGNFTSMNSNTYNHIIKF